MFCAYCGKDISDGAEFCPYCGKTQQKAAEPVKKVKKGVKKKVKEKRPVNTVCIVSVIISAISMVFLQSQLVGLILIGVSIFGIIDSRKKHERGWILGLLGIFLAFATMVIGSVNSTFSSFLYWLF